MEQFFIRELTLKNFRQFSSYSLEFHKGVNVLIGANGSGKTSILEAVNVMLGAYLAAYSKYVPSRFVYNIKNEDVLLKLQTNSDIDTINSPTVPQYPCSIGCSLFIDDKQYDFNRTIEKEGGRTKFGGSNPMQPLISKWENHLMISDQESNELILPLVLYLSSARLWNEDKKIEDSLPIRTDAYKYCLSKYRGTQFVFRYLNNLVLIANQERMGEPFPSYQAIMDAIRLALKDELPEGNHIEYSIRYGTIVQKKPDGTLIPFGCLSDGYRNVIKTVSEIAIRMCVLNPQCKGDVLKETPGIVLIDELDLSLHPNWQKRIVEILTAIFPRVQFICTTHSPFIIQSLKPGDLISLDEGVLQSQYSGESIEDISESIMNVDIPQWSEYKAKLYSESLEFFEDLKKLNPNDIRSKQELREKLVAFNGRYSDDPAFLAFLHTKYNVKMKELEKSETN